VGPGVGVGEGFGTGALGSLRTATTTEALARDVPAFAAML
jgi:hypothetical protein